MNFNFKKSKLAAVVIGLSITLSGCNDSDIDSLTRLNTAQEHDQAREFPTAIIELKNLLQQDQYHVAARTLLGKIYYKQGLYLASKKELSLAYSMINTDSDITFSYVATLLALDEFEEINTIFNQKTTWTTKQQGQILSIKLQIHIKQNNEQAAKALINSSQFEQLTNIEAIYAKALYFRRNNQLELAQELITQVLAIDPKDVNGLLTQGDILFINKDYQAALSNYQQAIEFRPGNLALLIKPIQALVGLKKYDQAEDIVNKILQKNKLFHQANYYYAYIKLLKEEYQPALEFANKVLNLIPSHIESQYIAAQSAFFLKQYQTSFRWTQRLANLFPNNNAILKLLAANQLNLKQDKEAVATLAKLSIINLTAKDAPLFIEAANILTGKDQLATREQLLLTASKIAPNNGESARGLAFISFAQGNIAAGDQYLLNALALEPNSSGLKTIIISSYLEQNKLKKAYIAIEKFISEDQNNPDGYTLRGLLLIKKNKKTLARAAFNHALELSPFDFNANSNMANLAILKSDFEDAKKRNQQILVKDPDNFHALKQMWQLEQKLDHQSESLNWLKKLTKAYPKDLASNISLAQHHITNKTHSEAMKVLQRLKADDKNVLVVRLLLGEIYYLNQQFNLALGEFSQASAIAPKDPTSRYWQAVLFEKMDQVDNALLFANKALTLMPDDRLIETIIVRLLIRNRQLDQAEKLVDKLITAYPQDYQVRDSQAKIALRQGKYQQAVTLFSALFKTHEINLVLAQLANALTKNGQNELAIEQMSAWVKRYPKDLLILNLLANEHLNRGQMLAARTQFATIVEITPNNAMAQNNIAWLLFKQGDLKGAQAHAEKAFGIFPKSGGVNDTLGQILLAQGKHHQARVMLRLANKKMPDNLTTKLQLARASALDGDKPAATDLLHQILTHKNSKLEANKALRDNSNQLLAELTQ